MKQQSRVEPVNREVSRSDPGHTISDCQSLVHRNRLTSHCEQWISRREEIQNKSRVAF